MASFASLDTPRSLWSRAPSTARRASAAAASYDGINSAPTEALLQIVAQGNVIISELLRLSSSLPAGLRGGDSPFAPVLPDFRYLKEPAAAERRIESNPSLVSLDDEFRERHTGLLELLYRLFEHIIGYHAALSAFFERLRDGAYIHATVESMLLGTEGKQLMVEAVTLLGSLLLLLDRRIPGPARERSVVAYFRAKGGAQAVGPSINTVIALCADTGFTASAKWLPSGYPETYLARLPVQQDVVQALLSRLRSDDIYSQIVHYPSPEHRSTALAQQAGQLYVLLFYAPAVLHNDATLMRVLVDKHFVGDNWVVSWAPGASADLAWEWANYKAAKSALASVATVARATQLARSYSAALPDLGRQLAGFLVEGMLREEFILQNAEAVLDCLRACNVTARWLMLHAAAKHPKLAPAVAAAAPSPSAIVALIMDTSLLEFEVKRVYAGILDSREERWAQARSGVADTLTELSEFYGGDGPLARRLADDSLAQWFAHLADQVEHMVLGPDAGRRVRSLAAALDEAEGHHAIEGSAQAQQHLAAARAGLETMVRIDHVREEVLATLGAVSDFAFAWGLMERYTPALQAQVRSDPRAVLKLRCVFLKLRSGLELPLLRVAQAEDPAADGLTRYYSAALLSYVRKVLEVVPATVIELVDRIVALQGQGLAPPAGRLAVVDLKQHAALPARAEVAALTRRIAALAQGILAMERTFMGVIEIDPVQLLEDGLRAGIARRISAALAAHLSFPHHPGPPLLVAPAGSRKQNGTGGLRSVFGGGGDADMPARSELQQQLATLGTALDGFRAGFEGVQDDMAVRGLLLWHQEYAFLVAAALRRERAASFPQPAAEPVGTRSSPKSSKEPPPPPTTFLGRVASQLLRLSDPVRTAYDASASGWIDVNGAAALSLSTFRAAAAALGAPGLAAVDTLFGLRAQQGLQQLMAECSAVSEGSTTAALAEFSRSAGGSAAADEESLGQCQALCEKLRRQLEGVAASLAAIGQSQLLRRRLTFELRLLSQLQGSPAVTDALESLSAAAADAARSSAEAAQQSPLAPQPLLEGGFLPHLTAMLHHTGLSEPQLEVYMQPQQLPALPSLLFLSIYLLLPSYTLAVSGNVQRRPGRVSPDVAMLAAGVGILLHQFPPAYTQAMLKHFGWALRAHIATATGAAAAGLAAAGVEIGLPREVALLAAFLRKLEAAGGVPVGTLAQHVPGFVLEAHHLAAVAAGE